MATEQTQKKSYEANEEFLAIMKICKKKELGLITNDLLAKTEIQKHSQKDICEAYRIVAGNFIFEIWKDRALADMVAFKLSPREEKFRADWDN